MTEYSVNPAGEKFAIPQAGDYAAELQRVRKLAEAARKEGKEIVVVSGLRAGEMVVTDGQSRLVPGAKVAVKTSLSGNIDTNTPTKP